MDYWNYLHWVAKYPKGTIKEDQSIKEHFMQLDTNGLQEISYVDGLTTYGLDCSRGQFKVNNTYLVLEQDNQKIPPIGPVATAVIRPDEQFEKNGIFQYKSASGIGEKNFSLGITSYNLGFHKVKGTLAVYQKLVIDAKTGKFGVQVKIQDFTKGINSDMFFEVNL